MFFVFDKKYFLFVYHLKRTRSEPEAKLRTSKLRSSVVSSRCVSSLTPLAVSSRQNQP